MAAGAARRRSSTAHGAGLKQRDVLRHDRRTASRSAIVAAAAEAAGAATVAATFTVPAYETVFGEHLRLVGDVEALGSWEVEGGLVLEWAEGNTWSGSAQLPAGPVEFKVVKVRGDGSAEWEVSANRTIDVSSAGSDSASVTVNAGDGSTDISSGSAAAADTVSTEVVEPVAGSDTGPAEVLEESTGVGTEAAGEVAPAAVEEELSHDFTVQSGDEDEQAAADIEAASEEPAVESEAAALVEENLIAGEAHPDDVPAEAGAAAAEQPAAEAAAREQSPRQTDEQQSEPEPQAAGVLQTLGQWLGIRGPS